jgi:hypothetical protein
MQVVRKAALRFGHYNRRRKLEHALDLARRNEAVSVLLVGVHGADDGINNLIERGIADAVEEVTGLGVGSAGPGWIRYVAGDGCALPFADDAFDLVFSNAVIEHVGDEARQRRFVSEHDRVGRSWMLTTPNRLFPVESHDHTVATHWSPRWADRSGSVSRLLSPSTLRALLPEGANIGGGRFSPTLTAWKSNEPAKVREASNT